MADQITEKCNIADFGKTQQAAAGGRGKTGGLSEYAGALGKAESTLRFYKEAAAVTQNLTPECEVSSILNKAKHLSAIHQLTETCWPDAVGVNFS